MRVSHWLFLLAALWVLRAAGTAHAQPLVVLDPGHGGSDPGAVGCSLEEADVVLDVALRLRTQLERAGIRVALTRDADESVSLSARVAFANSRGANGFFSVHANSNAGTPATGTETWIANAASARSVSLAELVQTEMVRAWGLRDRGVKRADFVVVRDTTMPSSLAEVAFINRCDPDARLLASPDARQRMAEAQARAILAWLGVMPGMDGTLRGVVFEDRGVGTMDLSVRIPGASVRIVETGARATAEGMDAAWLFTLPAGTYTVEASAPGYASGSRRCEVTAGSTTWCSVGLARSSGAADAAMLEPDASEAPDASLRMPDAFVASLDAAGETDTPDSPDGSVPSRPIAAGCGCRAAAPRPGLPAALASILLGLGILRAVRSSTRRRKRRLLLSLLGAAVASCAGPGGCASLERPEPPSSSAPTELARSAPRWPVRTGPPILPRTEHELLTLDDSGRPLGSPIIAPDSSSVLVAPPDASALFVVHVNDPSHPILLCSRSRCGYEPRYFGDGRVAFRTPEQSACAVPGDAVHLDGSASTIRLASQNALAWVEDDHRVVVRFGSSLRTLHNGDDRYVRAEVSPDGRFVVAWGLGSGLTVHRLEDGARAPLGAGGNPHFDPDGRLLVFDRTEDDGHTLTSGDIMVAVLGDDVLVRPVADGGRIATAPSISRIDGRQRATLAFERDGAVVLAEIDLD